MKTLLITLLMLISLQMTSFSQDQRRFVLGGTVSADLMTSTNDYNVAFVQLVPKFGYLITPKLALGLLVGFQYEEDYYSYNYGYYKSIDRYVSSAVFLRYQNTIAGNFKFFLEPASWITFNTGENSKQRNISLILDIGILYLIKDFMSVEISILGAGMSDYWTKGSDDRIYEFYIDYALLRPNIGILFYF